MRLLKKSFFLFALVGPVFWTLLVLPHNTAADTAVENPCDACVEPPLIYKLYQYSVNPMNVIFYIGSHEIADRVYPASAIVQATVRINETLIPTSMELIEAHPPLVDSVLKIELPVADFLESYPLAWDSLPHTYTITAKYSRDICPPLEMQCEVVIRGHISGDANGDGKVSIVDVTYIMNYLYENGRMPRPGLEIADVDSSGEVNLLDLAYLLKYLFSDGPAPACPQTNY